MKYLRPEISLLLCRFLVEFNIISDKGKIFKKNTKSNSSDKVTTKRIKALTFQHTIGYPNNLELFRLCNIIFLKEFEQYGSFVAAGARSSDGQVRRSSVPYTTAKLIHAEQIKAYVNNSNKEQYLAPQMYATLRSNLSEESIQLLSQERKFLAYEVITNYVGLYRS